MCVSENYMKKEVDRIGIYFYFYFIFYHKITSFRFKIKALL